MRIPYYHVDAFTAETFRGNPAGVCPLDGWLQDPILQRIASENNLSETAFFVRREGEIELRWFTPVLEVDLCGHATLAAAHVLFSALNHPRPRIEFQTRSGAVASVQEGDLIELDFPSRPPKPCAPEPALVDGLGKSPREVTKSRDYLVVYDSESDVRSLVPNMRALEQLDCLGIIVTAPGRDCDFVSRFFAPRAGIPEDPVTGSAHCSLIPFWADRLGKTRMFARQLSRRGGELYCRLAGDRVGIAGKAVTYGQGDLEVPC